MITRTESLAWVPVAAQVIGTVEVVAYAGAAILSIVQAAFKFLQEAFWFLARNQTKLLDAKIDMHFILVDLKDRITGIGLGILTIVPLVGYLRTRNAQNREMIKILEKDREDLIGRGQPAEARKILLDLEKRGSSNAMFALYSSYKEEGHKGGGEVSYKVALRYLLSAAKAGHEEAQCDLALFKLDGNGLFLGIQKDEKEGIRLLKQLAMIMPLAQNYLGICYQRGKGIAKSPELAAYWFKKATDKNELAGMRNYAFCLLDGQGVKKDTRKGIALLKELAIKEKELDDKALAKYRYELARIYELGGRNDEHDNFIQYIQPDLEAAQKLYIEIIDKAPYSPLYNSAQNGANRVYNAGYHSQAS